MAKSFAKCIRKTEQPFRLVPMKRGRHVFGGRCEFTGVTPKGTDVPIQQLLLLDLHDPHLPFQTEPMIPHLPLLYPFKYGSGGPEIQYAIRSSTKVEILHLSDPIPDDPEEQYLQVAELPMQPLKLKPLSYEEARCLAFMREDGFFQPNRDDKAILASLRATEWIDLGGRRNCIVNAPLILCRNPDCDWYGQRTSFQFIAAVSPITVNGHDDFWHEFRGGDVEFCFGFCWNCGTIIAFNVAT